MMIPAAIAISDRPDLPVHRQIRSGSRSGSACKAPSAALCTASCRAYLSERFPTEVRATASAFCYHQGAILGGLVAPVLAYFAINYNLGYAIPMLVGTVVAAVSVVIALSLSPETKGKVRAELVA